MTTRRVFTIVVLLTATLIQTAPRAAGNTGALGDAFFQIQPGRGARVSSSDPDWHDGNADNRKIKPGETLTVADIEGPGIIRHIWFTISAVDPRYGRSLVLRMYWDDQEEPAVESPLGDFFAVGHGMRRNVNSIPVAVTSIGRAYNCYWPMPFAKRARITLSNDATENIAGEEPRVRAAYFYVDYEKVTSLPPNTAYFHAQYRQEFPAEMGKNYLICDAEGEGHYVGTVLSVYSRAKGWIGEGDDFFFIDGETEPSLRGTGTEDYFCDAWGFEETCRPYYGIVVMDGYEIGDRVSVYRWHITDPVRFSKSLKLEIEHKGSVYNHKGENISGFRERPDLFSSVAFWYQTGKAKRFATVPPLEERVVPQTLIDLFRLTKDARSEPAGLPIEFQRGPYGHGSMLTVRSCEPGTKIIVPFKLEKAVAGIARLKLGTRPEGGIWSVSLDDQPIDSLYAVDTYAAEAASREDRVGLVDLAAGEHTLSFECKGKNIVAKDCWLAANALMIDSITPHYTESKKKKE